MVLVGLQISARLENIDKLETCHPQYAFFIKAVCTNCGETRDKWHAIVENEKTVENSRNPDGHNLFLKCKICKHENTIDIVEKTNEIYTQEDCGKFKTIVVFDCRGIEPTSFSPRIGWIAHSANNGQVFKDIDISEDDWVEYDEKNNVSVGIYDFTSKFIKLKK